MRIPTTVRRGALAALLLLATPSASLAGGHRVDVGGFKLWIHCVGDGSPTAVLDAGAGDTSGTWDWVVPEVRKFTRVCVYDRAGLGKSDAGPDPRTSDRMVGELDNLLKRSGILPPYVLVGHSFGGLNMRLFASRFPDTVAGLVLVDSTPEDFPAAAAALRSLAETQKLETARGLAPAATRAEIEGMAESAESVRRAGMTDAPVVVISAGRPEGTSVFRETWASLQEKMATSFPHGRQVVAQESGHYVQYDQPEVVADAIRQLVERAHAAHPAPPK